MWIVGNRFLARSKRIVETHTRTGNTEIVAMHTAFRTIHATAPGSIAIVQQFGRKASQHGTFRSLKDKRRNCRTILSEIDHQCLARTDYHFFTTGILLRDDNFSEFLFRCTFHTFPKISIDWRQSQIVTEVNFSSIRRQYLALEFSIHLRSSKSIRTIETHRLTGIIYLAIKNGRMLHRSGNACLPVFQIGAIKFLAAIDISQLEHTPEGTLLAIHTFLSRRSDNLIGPPTRGDLGRELVFSTGSGLKQSRYIVCKRALGLGIVRITRFQELFAHRKSVYKEFIHAQTCCHPLG